MSTRETRPPSSFATLSTDAVPIADRVDFWQELFVSCDVAKPKDLPASDFRGRIGRYTRGDGSSFARIEGGPLICHFGRYETGRKILGIVRSGTVCVRHDNGATTRLDKNSGLVLLDADRGLSTASTDYELAQLALPRELVDEALGDRAKGLAILPRDGLAPLLHAHLDALAAHGETLDEVDAATAMHVTASLATAFLSRAFRRDETPNAAFDDVLFAGACRYMEAHASRPDLTAASIAQAIGCSRAHLYRIFLARDRAVGDTLREMRLVRARLRLMTDLDRAIGTIAFESGYSDLSAFGKAFKRRFGVSPKECRTEGGRGAYRFVATRGIA